MCAHLLHQIRNTNAFKSLGSVRFKFVFPVKLFPSKSMLTVRYSLLNSSPWSWWKHTPRAGFGCLQIGARCYLGNLRIPEVGRYVPSWQIWHMGYMGPFRSNGSRAEEWLPRVPNVALSSPVMAGEALGQLVLPKRCWVPPAQTPATLLCTSQVCMGILEMLRHLKQCWALMGAQLHLVTSASQCYQNVSSCQKWGCCFLLHPSIHLGDTESSTGKANKQPVWKRKRAIFIGAKPQMETEISASPFYCIKKLSEGPGSGTNTRGEYF